VKPIAHVRHTPDGESVPPATWTSNKPAGGPPPEVGEAQALAAIALANLKRAELILAGVAWATGQDYAGRGALYGRAAADCEVAVNAAQRAEFGVRYLRANWGG
jgi:hypothetical protein